MEGDSSIEPVDLSELRDRANEVADKRKGLSTNLKEDFIAGRLDKMCEREIDEARFAFFLAIQRNIGEIVNNSLIRETNGKVKVRDILGTMASVLEDEGHNIKYKWSEAEVKATQKQVLNFVYEFAIEQAGGLEELFEITRGRRIDIGLAMNEEEVLLETRFFSTLALTSIFDDQETAKEAAATLVRMKMEIDQEKGENIYRKKGLVDFFEVNKHLLEGLDQFFSFDPDRTKHDTKFISVLAEFIIVIASLVAIMGGTKGGGSLEAGIATFLALNTVLVGGSAFLYIKNVWRHNARARKFSEMNPKTKNEQEFRNIIKLLIEVKKELNKFDPDSSQRFRSLEMMKVLCSEIKIRIKNVIGVEFFELPQSYLEAEDKVVDIRSYQVTAK